MKGFLYYNYKTYGDVLIIKLNLVDKPNKEIRDDDISIFYNEKNEIVEMRIHDFSQICKIKSEGRIVMPTPLLIDIINSHLQLKNLPIIDNECESGFIIGKVINKLKIDSSILLEVNFGKYSHYIYLDNDIDNVSYVVVCKNGYPTLCDEIISSKKYGDIITFGKGCTYKDLGIENENQNDLFEVEDEHVLGCDFFNVITM